MPAYAGHHEADPPIFRRLLGDIERGLHHHPRHQAAAGYDAPSAAASSVYQEPSMSALATTFKDDLEKFRADVMADVAAAYNKVKDFGEGVLPTVSAELEKAAGNPAIDAILSAVHLSPEDLQMVADFATKLDERLAALGAPADAGTVADGPTPLDASPGTGTADAGADALEPATA